VLKAANQNVKYCYEQALKASERASTAGMPAEQEFHLGDEKRWLTLAASFEYQERLIDFINELGALLKTPFCRVCSRSMRPKGMRGRQNGLAECDFECIRCGVKKTVIELDGERRSFVKRCPPI